jgi:DNA-directed RNA polymerase specialized sigma24 family protein
VDPSDAPQAGFATTRWSLVALARGADPDAASAALGELCEGTWYPLYAYARRRGLAREDALDATQGFFAEFLEHGGFARAERERGRLRAFLLGAFQRFLARRAEAAGAVKRGGARAVLSLDLARAEERYGLEPADELSPERLYEAAWARDLLARVIEALRAEHEARGKGAHFAALEGQLAGDSTPMEELAARLGTTPGAAKVAAHRLRARYRELLRQAILETLTDPAELEEELAALLAAVSVARPPEEAAEGR